MRWKMYFCPNICTIRGGPSCSGLVFLLILSEQMVNILSVILPLLVGTDDFTWAFPIEVFQDPGKSDGWIIISERIWVVTDFG